MGAIPCMMHGSYSHYSMHLDHHAMLPCTHSCSETCCAVIVKELSLVPLGPANLMHVSLGHVLEQKASRIETEVLDLHL
jgi:hypothetical protein